MVRRRVAVQLFLVLLVVSLVPLGGAGALHYHQTEQRIRDEVARAHEQLGTAAASLVENYVESAGMKVSVLAQALAEEPEERLAELTSKRLEELLLPADQFLGLSFGNTGGPAPLPDFVVSPQNVGMQQSQIASQSLSGAFSQQMMPVQPFQLAGQQIATLSPELFAAEPLVVQNLWQVNSSTGSLPLAVRVDEQRHLVADVNFDPLSRLLQDLVRGSGHEIVLEDSTTRVLAASTALLHPGWKTTERRLASGWRILVRESEEAAFAPLETAGRRILYWQVGSALLAVVLSVLLARRLLRPVRAMTRATEALEAGDLGARTGIERQDEIGRLAANFDRMAAAVQSLDRARSEFIGNVSHELRTPLTSMKCSVENLADGVASPETLPRIREDLDRLLRLTSELLDLAGLDAGATLSLQEVELAELAETCIANLEPLATRHGLTFAREFGAGTSRIDRARMHQVLCNLLGNAIKFSPPGGTITVTARPGLLAVRDEGAGVPDERREEIFERFVGEGGGLGLSIAKRIVELHGGTIDVQGSTFRVRLQ